MCTCACGIEHVYIFVCVCTCACACEYRLVKRLEFLKSLIHLSDVDEERSSEGETVL